MKKVSRTLSISLIIVLSFVSTFFISNDIQSINDNYANKYAAKISADTISITTNSLSINQSGNKSASKSLHPEGLSGFKTLAVTSYDHVEGRNSFKLGIDIRKRIMQLMTSRFYGSNYILMTLFI